MAPAHTLGINHAAIKTPAEIQPSALGVGLKPPWAGGSCPHAGVLYEFHGLAHAIL